MDSFNESRFLQRVDSALVRIKTILDNTRSPRIASDVAHSYDDKYGLAEFLTNTTIASLLNALENINCDAKKIRQMKNWCTSGKSVTLRLQSTEECTFNRKEERKVESASQNVTEIKSIIGKATITDKVVTTVRDYFWDYSITYEIIAFPGNKLEEKIQILERNGKHEIKTSSESTPRKQKRVIDGKDVNITWFIRNLNEDLQANFSIDRNDKYCHTPRRNLEIGSALQFLKEIYRWTIDTRSYFKNDIFNIPVQHGLDLTIINGEKIFVPVVPLLEIQNNKESTNSDNENSQTTILPIGDINLFLNEQKKSLEQKNNDIRKVLPESGLITPCEGFFIITLEHIQNISQHFSDGIEFIENMLRTQLISAIGKEISSNDFSEYMIFHNRKIFKDQYKPNQFCHAVRRPDHDPEGIFSISNCNLSNSTESIYTTTKKFDDNKNMFFAINAATEVEIHGDKYIHTWVDHCFSNDVSPSLQLKVRARQFSCYIIVLGTVISSTKFHPERAILVQNKDDVLIPLLLEQIPTPKAFRDAIESLSPEQQDFAKAFRQMQLDSTLFAICIIQIKPQLERLLNLTNDSLTKEIQLTQDLMSLFVEYQIPSDLLSFDGSEHANRNERLDFVKRRVSIMQNMIDDAKKKEIEDAKQKASFDFYSNGPPAPPSLCVPAPPVFSQMCVPAPPQPVCAPSMCVPAPPMMMMCGGGPPPPPGGGGAPPPPRGASISAPAPPSASTPVPPPQQQQQQQPDVEPVEKEKQYGEIEGKADAMDITTIPNLLNDNIDKYDIDASLHSTIIKVDNSWEKEFQKTLLSSPEKKYLSKKDLKTEKDKAFDLLDGLSRSGALPIYGSSLHVLIATTHCFDKTLINTVIQENVNPIEKVERSMLIVTSTIHGEHPKEFINDEHVERITKANPHLFD